MPVVVSVMVVQVAGLWKGTLRVWVLAQLQQGALRVRRVRRLGDVHCGEVRARQMQPGQLVWRREQLWWLRVDRWRRHHQLQRRRLVRQVLVARRQRRSQERQQVVLCYLVVAARRRQAVPRVRVLVVRVARLSRRVWLLVLWCLVVVDRQLRRERRPLLRRDLEVAASMTHRQQQAKRPVRQ